MLRIAQDIPPEVGNWTAPTPNGDFTNLPTLLTHGMNWLLALVGGLAVIALVYSGIMYITSAGDTNQAETAKKNMTWAIIGIILVALSAVIIRVVNDIANGTNPV